MTRAPATTSATTASTGNQDRQVPLDDPAIPPAIRAELAAFLEPNCTLWRCPRHRQLGSKAPQAHSPDVLIEWWLMDADGELIEAFWEEASTTHTLQAQAKPMGMPHLLFFVFCLCILAAAGGLPQIALGLLALLAVLGVGWFASLAWSIVFFKR